MVCEKAKEAYSVLNYGLFPRFVDDMLIT